MKHQEHQISEKLDQISEKLDIFMKELDKTKKYESLIGNNIIDSFYDDLQSLDNKNQIDCLEKLSKF